MMEKYYLFAYENYYPTGGADDFVESFDLIDDAIKASDEIVASDSYADFAHVANSDMEVVHRSERKV